MAIENIATLGSITHPNGEKTVVDLDRIGGRVKVQVRRWYEKDGDWFPAKQGITFLPDEWAAIVKFVPAKGQVPADAPKSTSSGTGRKL